MLFIILTVKMTTFHFYLGLLSTLQFVLSFSILVTCEHCWFKPTWFNLFNYNVANKFSKQIY